MKLNSQLTVCTLPIRVHKQGIKASFLNDCWCIGMSSIAGCVAVRESSNSPEVDRLLGPERPDWMRQAPSPTNAGSPPIVDAICRSDRRSRCEVGASMPVHVGKVSKHRSSAKKSKKTKKKHKHKHRHKHID